MKGGILPDNYDDTLTDWQQDPDYLIKTYTDMTDEQKKLYAEWLETRPASIQEACRKTPPYMDYTLTTTGKRARVHSIDEDSNGVITFTITTYNNAFGLVRVFGIKPEELEPIIV